MIFGWKTKHERYLEGKIEELKIICEGWQAIAEKYEKQMLKMVDKFDELAMRINKIQEKSEEIRH